MNIKEWDILPLNKNVAAEIADTFSLAPILAMLLQIRGADTEEKINELIGEGSPLDDPFIFKDMDKAVDRIITALENFERIAVYGDYDADGVTSTAMVYSYLASKGADVMYYIPNREGEGYGMNMPAVECLWEKGVKLIITVDNGISSVNEVAKASELGIDVIITDHHRPQEVLPQALAVIDPYRKDCPSEFKDFAGAGVALKLIMAIETDLGDPDELIPLYSDLAALGTIGDIVPLKGENRSIVRYGLESLYHTERFGVKALLEKSGTFDKSLNSTSVAFTLVPRINATGRMGVPDRAVKLLTGEDYEDCLSLAEEICGDNTNRREVEAEISQKVIERIETDESIKYSRIMVVDGEDWHHGVVGIVAAKITDKYGKPCMIISYSGNEAKGSGRSVDGFDLFKAVSASKDSLVRFGGHPMAAGITLEKNKIPKFRELINSYARQEHNIMPVPKITIDCKLMPAALSVSIPESLAPLEPYGGGNPLPVFGLYGMTLDSIVPVGGGKHLRLNFIRDGAVISCMKFSQTQEEFPFGVGSVMDLAVTLDAKMFRGNKSLTILIKEMKLSSLNMEETIHSYKVYEKYKLKEQLIQNELDVLLPTRNDLASLYRFLRSSNGFNSGILELLSKLNNFNLGKLKISLDILCERGLITLKKRGDSMVASINEVSGKVDIFASPVVEQLRALAV